MSGFGQLQTIEQGINNEHPPVWFPSLRRLDSVVANALYVLYSSKVVGDFSFAICVDTIVCVRRLTVMSGYIVYIL